MFKAPSQTYNRLLLAALIFAAGSAIAAPDASAEELKTQNKSTTQHNESGVVGGLGGTGNTSENEDSGAATRGLNNLNDEKNEAPQLEHPQKSDETNPQKRNKKDCGK